MNVLKPNKNSLSTKGGYTSTHHGYDHRGTPDPNYYSSFHGVVVQSKNSETRQWIANTESDPWYVKGKTRKLKTEDYGNYIKIKSTVDGKTVYQLAAHFKAGSVLPVGTEVKKGQTVAQIGSTGNSTGNHSHTEYRDANEKSFEVEFVNEEPTPQPIMEDKRQQILDIYKGTTGEYANEDEVSFRLQKNENRVELIEDIMKGDGRAKARWTKEWGVSTNTNNPIVVEAYKESYDVLKQMLGLVPADNTQDVEGAVKRLLERNTELEKQAIPDTIYRIQDKDFKKLFSIGNITLITEGA